MTSVVRLRPLRWPEDREQLEVLDTTFTTDQAYAVHSAPSGFALVERSISPMLSKRYHVSWEGLTAITAAIVAERDEAILGVAGLTYQAWNRRAIVSHLYVDRAERGGGVGRCLLSELQRRAYDLAARCLWVETQDVNTPAIRFYRKHGFLLAGLDTSLYDPRDVPGETALFFALCLEGDPRTVETSQPAV